MNIAKMMKQAEQMQKKMQAAQQELHNTSFEVSAGGGKVTVTATAAGQVTGIKIAPEVVDPEDVEMLEDLILSALKLASEKSGQIAQEEMSKVTGGLGLPPGLGF